MNQLATPILDAKLILIPLTHLSEDTNGVRKTNGVSITELAASIAAEGLIQNLTVIVDPHSPLAGALEYQAYTVIAGCRRLRALRDLAKRGKLPADLEHGIPCRLVDASQALTVSLAENAVREAMHPADEFVAFRDMIDQGKSVDDVAARYGITPQVVQRRLKLARVAPKLLEQFRNDKITLAQMMALAIVDDHAAQEKAWGKSKNDWSRAPDKLRELLTKGEIDAARSPVAKFVGLQEYERAGGKVHRDLFDDKGGGYITDRQLLQELATKKLGAVAERVRKEGWSFIEVREEIDLYGRELSEYSRAEPDGYRKQDDAEKKRVAALNAERKRISDFINSFDRELTEAETEECDRLDTRYNEIEAEIEDLEQARTKWDPKILAKGGAFIGLDPHSGSLRVYRGLVKGKLRQAKDAKKSKAAAGGGSEAAAHTVVSDSLMRELSTCVSYALGAELIADRGLAVIALAHRLVLDVFFEQRDAFDEPVKISRASNWRSQLVENDVTSDNADFAKIEAEREALNELLPDKGDELLGWLRTKAAPVARLLAFCVAASIDAVTGREDDDRAHPLANALKLNMSTRWTARPDNYLKRVNTTQILAALKEAGADKTTLAKAAALKKGELVTFAQPLLATWLPKPLRFDSAKTSTKGEKA